MADAARYPHCPGHGPSEGHILLLSPSGASLGGVNRPRPAPHTGSGKGVLLEMPSPWYRKHWGCLSRPVASFLRLTPRPSYLSVC